MENSRHLSSLKRGLRALGILNAVGRITASDLAKRVGVPRTTAHRILDTLVAEGYVAHDRHSHGYQLTAQVRRLAFGFNRDELIAEIARPILRRLCRDVLTPVGLTTPVGRDVVIQVSLDYEAPLALERLPEGTSFPVTYGPSGHLFLAHCGKDLRSAMIEGAGHSPSAQGLNIGRLPTDADLDYILKNKFALSIGYDPHAIEGVMAVPVYLIGAYVGSVHLRFMKRVMSPLAAVERFLAKMQEAALEIEQALEERMAETDNPFDGMNRPLLLADSVAADTTH